LKENEEKRMRRAVFAVRDIDCATCALAIEKRVKKIEGVKSVGTALLLNRVFIDYDESKATLSEITEAIDEAGYSNYLVRRE
jgi:P-type Cu+ transporter